MEARPSRPGTPNPQARTPDRQAARTPGPQVRTPGPRNVRTPNPPPHQDPAGNSQEPYSPQQDPGWNTEPPEGLRDAPQHAPKPQTLTGHASSPRGGNLRGAPKAKQERHRPRAASPARQGARALTLKPTSRKHEAATHGPAPSQGTVRDPAPGPAQARLLPQAASTDAGSRCAGGSRRLSAPPLGRCARARARAWACACVGARRASPNGP